MTERHKERTKAVREALGLFRTMWPRRFNAEAESLHLELYDEALGSITIDCIVPAARKVIATSKYAPLPAEFREVAVEVERARYPHLFQPKAVPYVRDADVQHQIDLLDTIRNRKDEMGLWLKNLIKGDWSDVESMFAIMWQQATTDEQRLRLRRCELLDEEMRAAYRIHRKGKQSVRPAAVPPPTVPLQEDDGGYQYAP